MKWNSNRLWDVNSKFCLQPCPDVLQTCQLWHCWKEVRTPSFFSLSLSLLLAQLSTVSFYSSILYVSCYLAVYLYNIERGFAQSAKWSVLITWAPWKQIVETIQFILFIYRGCERVLAYRRRLRLHVHGSIIVLWYSCFFICTIQLFEIISSSVSVGIVEWFAHLFCSFTLFLHMIRHHLF